MDKKPRAFYENIWFVKCKLCPQKADVRLFIDDRSVFLCLNHWHRFKKKFPGEIQGKFSEDLTIPLQNYKNKNDEVLFKTKSTVETSGKFSWEHWRDFGRKQKIQKDLENSSAKFFCFLAWKFGEKADITIRGEKLILVEYQETYLVFSVLGTPLFECGSSFEPIFWFNFEKITEV